MFQNVVLSWPCPYLIVCVGDGWPAFAMLLHTNISTYQVNHQEQNTNVCLYIWKAQNLFLTEHEAAVVCKRYLANYLIRKPSTFLVAANFIMSSDILLCVIQREYLSFSVFFSGDDTVVGTWMLIHPGNENLQQSLPALKFVLTYIGSCTHTHKLLTTIFTACSF
jgi:hypothetical protein